MTKLFLFFSKRSQQQRTANLRKSKRIEGRRFLTIGYDGEVRSPLRDRKNTPRGGGTGNATVQRSKSAQTPSNKTKHLNKKNNIADKAPALAEMCFALGAILGPILGGGLKDWKGFTFAVDILAAVVLFIAIMYCSFVLIHSCCGRKRNI